MIDFPIIEDSFSLKELINSILENIPESTQKVQLICEIDGEGNYYPAGTGKGALITFEFFTSYAATAKLQGSEI